MDRDSFIQVIHDNVKPSETPQFAKKQSFEWPVADNEPYDYLSIMHYGKSTFSIDPPEKKQRRITMKTKDPCYQDLIGKEEELSYYDHKSVNEAYGCTRDCQSISCGVEWSGENCYSTKTTESEGKCICLCMEPNRCSRKKGAR